jgi:hypothetical protein
MISRRPIVSLVWFAIAACFFEPSDRVTGQWGGNGISLDARNAEVQVEFACGIKALTGAEPGRSWACLK